MAAGKLGDSRDGAGTFGESGEELLVDGAEGATESPGAIPDGGVVDDDELSLDCERAGVAGGEKDLVASDYAREDELLPRVAFQSGEFVGGSGLFDRKAIVFC